MPAKLNINEVDSVAAPSPIAVPVPSTTAVIEVSGRTIAGGGGGSAANIAVTLLAASIVTLQAPVPEQAPDQPLN
jgi:hypothetical protein